MYMANPITLELTLNVVTIPQTSKLFLASCIPYIKFNGTSVSVEHQRMDFDSQSSCNKMKC